MFVFAIYLRIEFRFATPNGNQIEDCSGLFNIQNYRPFAKIQINMRQLCLYSINLYDMEGCFVKQQEEQKIRKNDEYETRLRKCT